MGHLIWIESKLIAVHRFLVEMLTDLNAPNDCAAISQKYRERAYQEDMILMCC